MKSVALLIETSNAYARGLLHGIDAFIQENEPWSIHLPEQGRGAEPPVWLRNWKGDGIIARIENRKIANALKRLNTPVVDVSSARLIPELPWVETNDDKIADLAFQHFLERGFRNLAFCGEANFNWSKWRQSSFEARANESQIPCFVHNSTPELKSHRAPARERNKMAKWIRSLPKPIGVFACYDNRALAVLDICREEHIEVPEEVAVLGVDNDELLCRLCKPPLSSVIPNTQKTGYEAARLLEAMMSGENKETKVSHLVDPIGIASRQSTELLATDDTEVNLALRLIKEYACDNYSVSNLIRQMSVSRRSLESRFLKTIGRTPYQEIARIRIERIKELLISTKLSLSKIANLTGFQSTEYLSVFFKRETGSPPGEFRSRNLLPG